MPSLFRFLLVVGLLGGLVYAAISALTQLVDPAAARDDRDDPARQAVQAAPLTTAMARRSPRAGNETLIELFLDMLAAERGASAQHARCLPARPRRFRRRSRHGPAAASPRADSDELRAHLGRLAKRGLAAASVARRLSAIRQLYRFLYSEGHRGDDPAAVIEGPKRGRSLPKVLSIKQVDDLLAQARDGMKRGGKVRSGCARRGSTACWRCSTPPGLRVSELVALPEAAARRDQRMLVIRGKGGRERLVPLNDQAKRAMTDYLALRAEAKLDKSKWLFPSFGESGHLTRQHFARELKALAARRRA